MSKHTQIPAPEPSASPADVVTQKLSEGGGVDMADLKKKSVRGGMVTMVSQAITIAVQLTSTVVLARLLSPSDYGVIAMVTAVTGFAGLFRDLGLSSAAIQKRDLTHEQQSNLFWLNAAMGALLTIIVASASPLVVWFYGKPELLWVTVALSFSFLIGSLGTQHGARLVREMQFGRKAAATITGAIVTLAVAAGLAFNGWSYWSLVWGTLSGSAVTTTLLFWFSPFWPKRPCQGSGIRDMLKFGANITAFDFVNYFARNLDNILIGRFWGAGPLGMYNRAYQLLMFPINAIRGPINTVAFPAMSRLQSDPENLKRYYLKITNLIAWLSMPVTAFLWVSSREVVNVLLGPEWGHVAPIFSWLAVAAFFQPASGMVGSLLMSLGMGRRYFECGFFNAVVYSIGFLIGVRWGTIGVAISYAITAHLVLVPWFWWALRGLPIRPYHLVRAVILPMMVSILSSIAAKAVLHGEDNHFSMLLFAGSIFLVVFLCASLGIPAVRREVSPLLSGFIRRNRKCLAGS